MLASDTIGSLLQDREAMLAVVALIVATASAVASNTMREGRGQRSVLIVLSLFALAGGSVGAWLQHASKASARAEAQAAKVELRRIEDAATAAAEHARVNELAPDSRFQLRLSVDPEETKPCQRAAAINNTLHGTLDSGVVRVVKRPSYKEQPYCLLLGRDLTLSAAQAFQELAKSNIWAHGRPELEPASSETPVDCKKVLQQLKAPRASAPN